MITEKLMPMMQNGLAKLIEECGEVLQIAGKLVQYPHLQASAELHPDGTHLLTELQNELADVAAAGAFVAERLKLDLPAIDARIARKLELFKRWDRERPRMETKVCRGCKAPNTAGHLLPSGLCTACEVL